MAETKDDDFETGVAGVTWDSEGARLPACAAERGAFMAPFGYSRRVRHPYSHDPRYKHFQESLFHHAAFSAAAVPFAWVMKNSDDGIPDRAKAYIGTDGLNVRLRVDGLGGLAREMLAGNMGAAA